MAELAGHPWLNPIGSRLWRDYDRVGLLELRPSRVAECGLRLPPRPRRALVHARRAGRDRAGSRDIALPKNDRTVTPEFEVRSVSRPLLSSSEIEDALWYLRIGANEQYGIMHHGQRHLTEHPEQRKAHPEYYVMLANGKRDNESRTGNACLSSEGFFR